MTARHHPVSPCPLHRLLRILLAKYADSHASSKHGSGASTPHSGTGSGLNSYRSNAASATMAALVHSKRLIDDLGAFELSTDDTTTDLPCDLLLLLCRTGAAIKLMTVINKLTPQITKPDEHHQRFGRKLLHVTDADGYNLIHIAILFGHLSVVDALMKQLPPPISTMFAEAAHTDTKQTPLMMGAAAGNMLMCTLLISRNADLYARDAAGRTAIEYASINGHATVASKLIKAIVSHGYLLAGMEPHSTQGGGGAGNNTITGGVKAAVAARKLSARSRKKKMLETMR